VDSNHSELQRTRSATTYLVCLLVSLLTYVQIRNFCSQAENLEQKSQKVIELQKQLDEVNSSYKSAMENYESSKKIAARGRSGSAFSSLTNRQTFPKRMILVLKSW
jgi:hypothetical protein